MRPDRERPAPKRVLLVDDEPPILLALKLIVELHGWRALVARSGAEALALVEEADAVVTDFCMPEMDGLELLRAIRQRGRSTPVIVLSAHRSERLADGARRAGALELVAKPFDIDAMALAIERALEAGAGDPRP